MSMDGDAVENDGSPARKDKESDMKLTDGIIPPEFKAISNILGFFQDQSGSHAEIKIQELEDYNLLCISSNCIFSKHKRNLSKKKCVIAKNWPILGKKVLMLSEHPSHEGAAGDGPNISFTLSYCTEDVESGKKIFHTVDLDSDKNPVDGDILETVLQDFGVFTKLKRILRINKQLAVTGTLLIIPVASNKKDGLTLVDENGCQRIRSKITRAILHDLQDYLSIHALVPRIQLVIQQQKVPNYLYMRSLIGTHTKQMDDGKVNMTCGLSNQWQKGSFLLQYYDNCLQNILHIQKRRDRALSKKLFLVYNLENEQVDDFSDMVDLAKNEFMEFMKSKHAPASKKPNDQHWVQCTACYKWRKLESSVDESSLVGWTCSQHNYNMSDESSEHHVNYSCDSPEDSLYPEPGLLVPATPARSRTRKTPAKSARSTVRTVRLSSPIDMEDSTPLKRPKFTENSHHDQDDNEEKAVTTEVEETENSSVRESPKKSPRKSRGSVEKSPIKVNLTDRLLSPDKELVIESPKRSPQKRQTSVERSLVKADEKLPKKASPKKTTQFTIPASSDDEQVPPSFDESDDVSTYVLTQKNPTRLLQENGSSQQSQVNVRDEEYYSLSDGDEAELTELQIKELKHLYSVEKRRYKRLASTVCRFLTSITSNRVSVTSDDSESLIAVLTNIMEDPTQANLK